MLGDQIPTSPMRSGLLVYKLSMSVIYIIFYMSRTKRAGLGERLQTVQATNKDLDLTQGCDCCLTCHWIITVKKSYLLVF